MRWTQAIVAAAMLCAGARVAAQNPPEKNPLEGDPEAIRAGMAGYRVRCADCHGTDGHGVRGPDITQVWASGRTDSGLFGTIRQGVPNTEMPSFLAPRTSDREIWQVLAYLRTLAAPAPADPPRGNAENGARLFRANCSACHRVNAVGGRLGPDLSRIGSARPRDVLFARIRRGSEDFRAGFEPVTITPETGPADPGREEERRPVLRPDHGHARADPGIREGQDEGRRGRHAGRRCPSSVPIA